MGAAFTRGKTFTIGETVNAAEMEALVGSATVANIDRSNITTSAHSVITRQSTAPINPYTRECWMISGQNAVVYFDGTNWHPTIPHFQKVAQNRGSVAIGVGSTVAIAALSTGDTFAVKLGEASEPWTTFGVALTPISVGGTGVIQTTGICRCNFNSTPVVGRHVKAHPTIDGVAEDVNLLDKRVGPLPFGIVISSVSSESAWISLQR